MKERPILFSGPMVRAILDGTKTQTRRVVKHQPKTESARFGGFYGTPDGKTHARIWGGETILTQACPYGALGDRLWVREMCSAVESHDGLDCVRYEADQVWRPIENTQEAAEKWLDLYHYRGKRGATVPSIHMPRWASRITLGVRALRVERLQNISHDDAVAEGVECWPGDFGLRDEPLTMHQHAFSALWNSINANRAPWESNPWVWVVEFRKI